MASTQRYYDAATVINAIEQTTGLGEIERRSSDNRVVCPARKLNNRKITGTSSEKESTTENPFRETDNPEVYKSIPSQEVTMDAGPPLGLWFWCWECQQYQQQ